MAKRQMTWGEIYREGLAKGYDQGYAALRADAIMKSEKQKRNMARKGAEAQRKRKCETSS